MAGGAERVAARLSRLGSRARLGSHPHLQNPPDRAVRVPVPDFRSVHPSALQRPVSLRPDAPVRRRYRARSRKLTLEKESAIRPLAATRSLRSLAADFGVSHETIRAVLRQGR